jgi:hypothetical protein
VRRRSPVARMHAEANPPRRFGALLVVTFLLLGVQGIVSPGAVQQIVVAGLAGLTLVLALRAAITDPRLLVIAGAFACAVLLVSIYRAVFGGIDEGAARLINAALIVVAPPAIGVGIVRDIRTAKSVRVQAVMGVLSLYVLLGILFAFVYGAVDHLGGDPFFAGGGTATVSHCLYFSFTTLSTVGYGDFVARSDLGHTLAVFEMLLGQIYLVTVVSLIVGNLGRPTRADG